MDRIYDYIAIKKLYRIVLWSILSLCTLILIVYVLLGLSPVQQKVKDIVLQEIMKKTNSKISIGSLRFRPFNRLQLEELYATDLKNDTLLYIEKINAGFNLFKLLRNQVVIHSIEIDRFDLHISKDSLNAPFNFQFFIDAFSSDTTSSADGSSMQIALETVSLKNGRLRYDVFSEPYQAPGLFDFNHIDIQNLQFKSKMLFDNIEAWKGSVDHFSFEEKSGFALNQMKFMVKNRDNKLQVDRFSISLPQSEAEIEEVILDYPGLQLSELLSGASYSILFTSGKWYLNDFSCFYPEFAHFTEKITCSGEIKGKLPEIALPHFELNYGKQLRLKFNAGISDFNALETSAFELNLKKCRIDPAPPIKLPLNTGIISLTGNISGSLPDLKLSLTAKSKQGDLTLTGTGGYSVSSGIINFDLGMESPGYDVKTLLSDSAYGHASFRLLAQGTIIDFEKIAAKADAEIRQFDYLGYSYGNISAQAAYSNDSVSIDLISKDAYLPFVFRGQAGLNKANLFAQFTAKFNGIQPDVLHLLPQYPGSKLSGSLQAHIKGFDPDLMSASISIDSFRWTTPSEDFKISPVTLSYLADANKEKQINLRSPMLNIRGKGSFTYDGIGQSLKRAFPFLFSSTKSKTRQAISERDNFDFFVGIRQANTIARLLQMETTIPDSAFLVGKYNREGENLNLNVNAFCIFTRSDTAQIRLNLSNIENNLVVQLDLKNRSQQYELEGNTGAIVEFIPNLKREMPDMNIALSPGSLTLNGASFKIHPAKIVITDKRYEINNFAFQHSTNEYLKIEGTVSDNTQDSLQITVNQFQIGTILSALNNKIPLTGAATGEITFRSLTTQPLIFSRNFAINDLVFDENAIGNIQLRSIWSSERQGLALRASWKPPEGQESTLSGFFLPARDSLALTANIQGIQLKWFSGYLPESVYGLTGKIGAYIKINGKTNSPDLQGKIYLNDATAGVRMLNTKYRISDSIFIENDQIVFRNCMVYDELNQNMKINGNIRHNRFSELNPKLTFDFNQFLVLNNKEQTDSLFYGFFQTNGSLNLLMQNKDWLLQGRLSNGRSNNTIMVNLPEQAIEAERYNWLTFVNTSEQDSIATIKGETLNKSSDFSFPLRLQITFSIDPNLSIGAIYNPDTKDAAIVAGRGTINFSYYLANPVPRLMGNYVIDNGKCTLSLKNITKKTFSVQAGGKLNFQGAPTNITFDLTAKYSLRTYLTNLDPSFAGLLTASKIPVNCLLTANGNLENMQLKYRIELPDQSDDIQRKLDGLIYSDELMIKEIAYLLAFGTFMPINSNSMNSGNTSLWTSLASSSITNQLNNLLSGVLNEKWTIGTNLYSNDSNFSDVDMDVNISTRLFNDRLTFNSTLGYHNNPNQTNNFTGDFNFEYKLTPSGHVLLQFYNVTNNQYYDKSKSPLTQGVGIVYKREGRTFRQLFRSLQARRR